MKKKIKLKIFKLVKYIDIDIWSMYLWVNLKLNISNCKPTIIFNFVCKKNGFTVLQECAFNKNQVEMTRTRQTNIMTRVNTK